MAKRPAWASRPPTNHAGEETSEAGRHPAERGRRRTRQDQDFTSAEAARIKLRTELRIRNERRKPVSSAAPASKGTNAIQSSIQPFDLMSRRHPLSSVGLSDRTRFCSKRSSFGLQRRAGIKPPASLKGEELLLLLRDLAGLLRSLLHCALRLLSLLSFLSHVALLM